MQKEIRSFDGIRINYDISKVSGSFLIFLHGLGGDLTAWKKERAFFHKKGISTLAIDMRGHGLSDRPKSVSGYSLENFAKDVHCIIKKEKIRNFSIVGHCFGGVVTITFHKLYPHLARSYILIDTTYKAPQTVRKIFGKHLFFTYLLNTVLKYRPVYKKYFSHVDFRKFQNTGDWNLKRVYSDIMHTSFKSWLFTYENLANFNGMDILKNMDKPVLIIEGEKDSIFNVLTARKIKNLIKKSKLDIIPKENHIIVLNNPKILEEDIFRFVSSLQSGKFIYK